MKKTVKRPSKKASKPTPAPDDNVTTAVVILIDRIEKLEARVDATRQQ